MFPGILRVIFLSGQSRQSRQSVCQSVSLHWATAFFKMILNNTQFNFMLQNNWTLPFCTSIENSIRQDFFIQMVLEDTQFEFM